MLSILVSFFFFLANDCSLDFMHPDDNLYTCKWNVELSICNQLNNLLPSYY